ncbi:hypothetical protein MRX96_020581 [Rhipicephalus microplus]
MSAVELSELDLWALSNPSTPSRNSSSRRLLSITDGTTILDPSRFTDAFATFTGRVSNSRNETPTKPSHQRAVKMTALSALHPVAGPFWSGSIEAPHQRVAGSPASRPSSPRLRGAGALLSVSLETLVAPRVPVRRRRAKSLGDLSQMRPPWEPRRVTLAASGPLDDVCLQGLSREQLVRRWRDSERRLLNLLREAVREKQALERKLAFLHNALRRKPP